MSRMPSVMQHNFSVAPQAQIQRSSFNRSCGFKTTFDAGYLVPVFVDEALPGDTFNLHMNIFARLATPIHPIMDNMYLDSFFFAVPYRLVWDNWNKFNGEQRNPADSVDFLVPQMVAPVGGYAIASLSDYFGLPTGIAGYSHSALWHRAYNLIWNEWFRDENLQNSVVVDLDDGPDNVTDYVLLRRGKRHDYFTSCLPWPQKGPAVTLPLGSNAPVLGIAARTTSVPVDFSASQPSVSWVQANGAVVGPSTAGWLSQAITGTAQASFIVKGNNTTKVPEIYADLSSATALTINALRQSFQIQRLYERDARGGTRYIEIIKSHFGVTSPDARLQRPEFLGGGRSNVIVNPIAQTSSTDATTPQGNLAAFGIVSSDGHRFVKSFTEHCLIIGMVCVRADLNYQSGLNRMWSRRTRFDFYWPALSHIGEQSVLNKEIYTQGTASDDLVFGYQERFAEYRYKPSLITGLFRSQAASTLDSWHLAQKFTSLPLLNSTFIQETPPIDRVVAVPTQPDFLFDSFTELYCARPMPMYSVPGLVDHF